MNAKAENTNKPCGILSVLKRLVIFRPKRGEVELKIARNSLFFFWPRVAVTNVSIGCMTKTGFMLKTYNRWSEEKFKSVAILVLGFGIGVSRSYEEI